MTATQPAIALDVDLGNPGQFLACCGLLELASRFDPEALGWFEEGRFLLSTTTNPVKALLACPCEPLTASGGTDSDDKSPPVRLGEPLRLLLDWWTDPNAEQAGFKTWAGGQTVLGFVQGMREHIKKDDGSGWNALFAARPIRKPKPFYFDSRISRLTSLDLGFSPDGFTTAFSPAVELLALIGMQRFRPATIVHRERYAFATWSKPLPVSIAAAVAAGLICTLVDQRYQFPLVVRTGGKYKAFGPAITERSFHARPD